jgi:solute carrier family 25 (mitochondrial adenine nucleotide translocator), member 4/5/6/31
MAKTSHDIHPLYFKLCSGGGASVLSKTCIAPFERTKLLLQTTSTTTSPLRLLSSVVQQQGILALWRGNFANCVRVFPTYALRFAFFDFYQDLAAAGAPSDAPLPMWRQLGAGGLSGATTLTLTYPLDLLRTRLATNFSGTRPTVLSTITSTFRGEGLCGFYKGYIISVIEITPYLAVSMGGYNWLKETFEESEQTSSSMQRLLFGWVSGTIASLACYPMDTIKRRMMLIGSVDHTNTKKTTSAAAGGSNANTSIVSIVRDVLRCRGLRGLYAGGLVNALNSGPAAAITFTANDWIKEWLL